MVDKLQEAGKTDYRDSVADRLEPCINVWVFALHKENL